MKTLALEFSTDHRSVAVRVPGVAGVPARAAEARHWAGRPTPAFALIERALAEAGVARAEIEQIAIGLGPGSATGIRTAVAIAQGWQIGRAVKLIGLGSLGCLAAQLHAAGERGSVHLLVDAQRREYHVAGYRLSEDGWEEVTPLHLASAPEIQGLLEAGERVLGPGVSAVFAQARDAYPEAGALARLAEGLEGLSPATDLEPIHLRPPDFAKAPPPRGR